MTDCRFWTFDDGFHIAAAGHDRWAPADQVSKAGRVRRRCVRPRDFAENAADDSRLTDLAPMP